MSHLSAVSTASPKSVVSCQEPGKRQLPSLATTIRVGIAGCGVGGEHVEAYKQLPGLFEVQAVCDRDGQRAQQFCTRHGIGQATTSFSELCRQDDIDVVDICTPPHLHHAHICEAMASGKHVICEKPIASSMREVDELLGLAAASGLKVMPIFQNRYRPEFQKLSYLLGTGMAGRLHLATVETCWRRRAAYYATPWRGKWETEIGGCLVAHAIHAHDLLFTLCGAPASVFTRIATRVNPVETEDCASISLELADGALASLSATLGSSQEITRLRLCFENLCVESATEPYHDATAPWTITGDTPGIERAVKDCLRGFHPEPPGFAGQLKGFHDALSTGTHLRVTLDDARQSIEFITAAYKSAVTGLPVGLPIAAEDIWYEGWIPRMQKR